MGTQSMDSQLLEVNAAIADDYSTFVYDPVANPLLDIDRIFGQAALFGELGKPVDVLDLACGTGVQLARIADQVSGRLVGTDISPEPARLAQERLTQYGARAEVLCCDLLDVDPEALGQFDLIYNIGVIYVVPPAVQRKIIDLIGKCLRPGGVAVLSYHAGSLPAIRTNLHRLLSAGLENAEPAVAMQEARDRAQQLAGLIEHTPGADLLRATVSVVASQSDVVFYHEVFNSCFGAMQTSAIARELVQYGLDFAWYLSPFFGEVQQSSLERSISADVADFISGQYRYAVFAKYHAATPLTPTSPQLRWGSDLHRDNPGEFDGEQTFIQRGGTLSATVRTRASAAMFDCLADGSLGWEELVAETGKRLAAELVQTDLDAMKADIALMWQHGMMTPLFVQ